MDEKTEELRDIFVDVAGEDAVTESQEESPGSLTADEEGVDERIAAVVERMRERFDFATALDTDALVTVVRGFYERDDDETIAAALDVAPETVFEARMDLHLFRDGDADAPFDLDALREGERSETTDRANGEERPASRDLPDESVERLADDLGTDPAQVRHYRRVVDAQNEARGVSHRFQSEFEDALADAGLATTMTESMREDGLKEATEDIGSLEEDADVSF